MESNLLLELERNFKRCSDCALHPDYSPLLKKLYNIDLSQEFIDYLCEKSTSKKHIWEIRFDHLRILLLNPSSKKFNLKNFYLENLKKSRRLAMKIFLIRGFAIYATEEELNPILDSFCKSLEKNHDYIDYNYILSVAGLPYLVKQYGYKCFIRALEKAEAEHKKIAPLLKGYFTLDTNLEQINLISNEECMRRGRAFSEKIKIYTLPINTPEGIVNVSVHHNCINESEEGMWTIITVVIKGRVLCIEAETTEQVLIKLAKSLPNDWNIKSCLSCRHGHFCPVGNANNELFCVTEFEPKQISNLWHVTEDDEERRKRSKNLFYLCDKYIPQSKDYFTYSDYFLELND